MEIYHVFSESYEILISGVDENETSDPTLTHRVIMFRCLIETRLAEELANCVSVTQWLQSQNRSVYKHWLVVMATGLMISKSLGSQ